MADYFSYKLTTENEAFSFDFSQVLASGETISSANCTVQVIIGTDPNPTAILSGGATYLGTKTFQRVLGGISEVTYRLVMTITTSLGNTYTAVGDIPVFDPSVV